MAVQEKVSARRLAAKVGRTIRVLIDAVEGGRAVGRSSADAPEIDGVVQVEGTAGLSPGDFVDVRILRAEAHDLWGVVERAGVRAARV
jgi:ribosomal protein S12 methylthiotransferase